jgi:hypothetical protein
MEWKNQLQEWNNPHSPWMTRFNYSWEHGLWIHRNFWEPVAVGYYWQMITRHCNT